MNSDYLDRCLATELNNIAQSKLGRKPSMDRANYILINILQQSGFNNTAFAFKTLLDKFKGK